MSYLLAYGRYGAAIDATRMIGRFPNIKIGLMVGIGGGLSNHKGDIPLGDVVVTNSTHPHAFYGTIASGNAVIKDASTRDQLIRTHSVLCFEMEVAKLMNSGFPCIVIRGISDYADSQVIDVWQEYAAASATRYAKDFLSMIPRNVVGNLNAVSPDF
ncbi:nucleoside phosphorylase domain-containing protein [Aspergillus leporis]|uniref:Nucleoside phosphorylase domain-containing protein n=1 Tax=Aspergillus leporis TaxID=41062 RepID=A0A5N5WL18_9EURO|nr:nucleoside phosphorylase domain-containing protein [Aspergillus leporis]